MLKFYSLLIGEDPAYTATFQPSSKRKVVLYATCMIIPVILWFISTYLLVSHVLGGTIISALTAAIVMAFIIFLIERSVIMSNGNIAIATFRISLGLIIALLGSISMDEVIFKNDIDNKIAEYRAIHIAEAEKKVSLDFSRHIEKQQQIVLKKNKEWSKSLEDAIGEADGTKGSGKANPGKITRLKLNVAALHEKDYQNENIKLQHLLTTLNKEKQSAKISAVKDFNGNGLLLRIKAMFDLISNDNVMLFIYILFTSGLFLIEFLVVIIKMSSVKSIDEDFEDARVFLLKAKTKKTLERAIQHFEPEIYDPNVQKARLAMKESSNFFNKIIIP
jgi:hypothetical protein